MLEDYNENYITGWIKIFRSIRNHWIWKDPVKFQWWIDILLEVNHKKKTVVIGNKIFDCNKGESLNSVSNWAARWNVPKKTAYRFLTMLRKDSMIGLKSETVTTRLSVCNYEIYQQIGNGNVPASETHRKRIVPTNKNVKNERNNNIYIKGENFYKKEGDEAKKIIDEKPEFKNLFDEYRKFVSYILDYKNKDSKNKSGESLHEPYISILGLAKQLRFDQFVRHWHFSVVNKLDFYSIIDAIENNKSTKDRKDLNLVINTYLKRSVK